MSQIKRIRPRLDFNSLLNTDLAARAQAVLAGTTTNYPRVPVDMDAFKTKLASFNAAISTAYDGSKTAIAQREAMRADIIVTLRDLAHHVESLNLDLPSFLLSGFEALSTTRAVPSLTPLAPTYVDKLEQGCSGELLVNVKPVRKARHYEVRYLQSGPDTPPGTWTSIVVANARNAVSINNLTPGKTYTFQVRAFGKPGYTDWSDPASRMCI